MARDTERSESTTRAWTGAVAGGLLLGAASGLRSQTGSSLVVLLGGDQGLPSFLRARPVRVAFALAMVGEFIADKLPQAGSRLAPGALGARLVLGGAAAGQRAWCRRRPVVPAVLAGSLAALGAAKAGYELRARLATKLPDPAVALAEDGVAAGLALAGLQA